MKKYWIFCFLAIPALVYADGPSTSLWGLFKLGGIWMWFLLLLSIISLGFIIEKMILFHKAKLDSRAFFLQFNSLVESRDLKKTADFIRHSRHLIARILSQGITVKNNITEFEKRIERASSIEVNDLSKGLNILATLGSVAPLVGFLGTVAGMIKAFGNIAAADEVSAQLVAGGIYTALTTTAYGLIIAIPSIAMYNFFVHKIDNLAADIEKAVNQILNHDLIK